MACIVAQRFQRVIVGADGKSQVVGEVGDKNQKLVDTEWNELDSDCRGQPSNSSG